MPKRRVPRKYVRDSKGRFARTATIHRNTPGKISRSRYKSKSELPRVEYSVEKTGAWKYFRAKTIDRKGQVTGEASGLLSSRKLSIGDVSKLTATRFGYTINDYAGSKRSSPSLEPGASLLTAASRVAGKKAMEVTMAVPTAHAFYQLTGGRQNNKNSWTFTYGAKARKALAGRRIVRVYPKKKAR